MEYDICITRILEHLAKERTSPTKLSAPNRAGVYALFALTPKIDACQIYSSGETIYIGKSDNLAKRPLCDHFISGRTGQSSPRRSLGAILKEELILEAIPRNEGKSEQDFRCYCFEDKGEQRLTDWMKKNIEVGVYEFHGDVKKLEDGLILKAKPILNLTKWPNPQASKIKQLRKRCVEEAKQRVVIG